MCKFFSAVSDGKGRVEFFTPETIARFMARGNPEGYDWNSHTSLMHSVGMKGKDEDAWNKWEYNPETKVLELDSGEVDPLDRDTVQKVLDEWFDGKDVIFLRNLFGRNSGHRNSGDRNSGDKNSGDLNSGDLNSGNWNSGDGNSGNRNSGHRNSGDKNSGDLNSGNWNSGDLNSGDGNSGDLNSGDGNSGDRNSGNWNSGDGNSGDGVLNYFCTERHTLLFDKPCTQKEAAVASSLPWDWFVLCEFVSSYDMTAAEKEANPSHAVTGGFLRTVSYKDAWKKCPPEFIEKVKNLANFDAGKFEEITGLKV